MKIINLFYYRIAFCWISWATVLNWVSSEDLLKIFYVQILKSLSIFVYLKIDKTGVSWNIFLYLNLFVI